MSKSETSPKEPNMIWTRSTDKYGRSVHTLRNQQMRALGVVVRMPKSAIINGRPPYLVNNWTTDEVTYWTNLKMAKGQLEAAAR